MSQQIGVVSLAEAGNLGDDLIAIAMIRALREHRPQAQIRFLSHGAEIDGRTICGQATAGPPPIRVHRKFEIPLVRQHSGIFSGVETIFIGGGGLFQTSHSAFRPYDWLSYVPRRTKCRVYGVGLGFGPLSARWIRRLRSMPSPFHRLWVRDTESLDLARTKLGWEAELSDDFVDRTFLDSLHVHLGPSQGRTLGVALRSWPGFQIDELASWIRQVSSMHRCDTVVFFVLESADGDGADVMFTRAVARSAGIANSRLEVYRSSALLEYCAHLSEMDVAISMKLHASALWSAWNLPIYPVIYAPKIASLFGRSFHGPEIVRDICRPKALVGAMRAHDAVRECLDAPDFDGTKHPVPFGRTEAHGLQVAILASGLGRRLGGLRGSFMTGSILP